jgi:hypothetical protein
MAAGYDGHVAKPIDPEGLLSTISRLTGTDDGQP